MAVAAILAACSADLVPRLPPSSGMSEQELAGLELFNSGGCTACHAVRGVGGGRGPDLSRAGLTWDAEAVGAVLASPDDPRRHAFAHLAPEDLDALLAFLRSLR